MRQIGALLAGTALAVGALASAANAGGFQRGVADTDILYEPGFFSTRIGFSYVEPQRGFESIDGVSGDFRDYTGDYIIPNAAVKFGDGPFACAGHYTVSFAAESDYAGSPGGALPAERPGGSRVQALQFDSNEVGATCRASYESERGRFSLLGGIFFEDLNFEGRSIVNQNLTAQLPGSLQGALGQFGAQVFVPAAIAVDARSSYQTGYRIGAAYEIPEIALRAQILYRSELKHDGIVGSADVVATDSTFVRLASGAQVSIPTAAALLARQGVTVPSGVVSALPGDGTVLRGGLPASLNTATSPQSLYINAQTGIAPGTLALASFRWTDWSTNNEVITNVAGQASTSPYFWDDGYTVSLGLGRAFNEQVSGAVALGFDSGVSTGAETTYTDLYTVSGGLSFKGAPWAEVRIGGLIGYLTEGDQSISDGAYFNATVGDDWVYAANASMKFTF